MLTVFGLFTSLAIGCYRTVNFSFKIKSINDILEGECIVLCHGSVQVLFFISNYLLIPDLLPRIKNVSLTEMPL